MIGIYSPYYKDNDMLKAGDITIFGCRRIRILSADKEKNIYTFEFEDPKQAT
jgi:hypothetical protein